MNRFARILAAAYAFVLLPVAAAGQPGAPPLITVRATIPSHLSGFERTNTSGADDFEWQHRLSPTHGIGGTLALPLIQGIGVRLDRDYVPELDLETGEGGPRLSGDGEPAHWWAASVWVAPAVVCQSVCLAATIGYGRAHYDFPQIELRGDVVNPVAAAQTIGVWRFGLDVRVLRGTPSAVIQVADYVGTVDPVYEGEELSTLHVLLIGFGIGLF
jgi:hypothetical protein